LAERRGTMMFRGRKVPQAAHRLRSVDRVHTGEHQMAISAASSRIFSVSRREFPHHDHAGACRSAARNANAKFGASLCSRVGAPLISYVVQEFNRILTVECDNSAGYDAVSKAATVEDFPDPPLPHQNDSVPYLRDSSSNCAGKRMRRKARNLGWESRA